MNQTPSRAVAEEGNFGLEGSILEVPTTGLAAVFTFFLVLSFGLEYGMHSVKAALRRRGREGLAQAAEKMFSELTVLGFVSLVVLLFHSYIPSICIASSTANDDWSLLSNIQGCPCCLKDTQGISPCAQIFHDCSFNVTSNKPYCGCDAPGAAVSAPIDDTGASECQSYVNNEIEFVADSLTSSLPWLAALSNTTLTKVCTDFPGNSTAPLAAEGLRRRGRLFLSEQLQEQEQQENEIEYLVPEVVRFRCEGSQMAGECSPGSRSLAVALEQVHLLVFLVAAFHVLASMIVVAVASLRMRQWRRWQTDDLLALDLESSTPLEGSGGSTQLAEKPAAIKEDDLQGEGEKESAPKQSMFQKCKKGWQGREEVLARPHHHLAELGTCLVQAFFINIVSRDEFNILRSAYLRTLNLPQDFDFVRECTLHLDFDLVRIIGSSFVMYFVLILMILFTGLKAWVPQVFLFVAMAFHYCINVALVYGVRYNCRGGRPHALAEERRWYRDVRLLAVPLGGLIFTASLTFSMAVFWAWQFGVDSCLFKKGARPFAFVPDDAPWWFANVGALVALLWTANVSVPTWALVRHTTPRYEESLAHHGGEGGSSSSGVKPAVGQQEIMKEIERLQAELKKMQD